MIDDGIPGDAPQSGRVSAWLSEIEKSHNDDAMARYNKRCQTIRKRYRYEGSAFVRARKYQLLWSNIETMKSAVYAKPPKGVVSRRHRDADPVGRIACEILERAINFSFDDSDFDGVFKQVRDDFLLYARGVARIYYEPEYETENDLNEDIEDAEDIRGIIRDDHSSDWRSSKPQGAARSGPEGNSAIRGFGLREVDRKIAGEAQGDRNSTRLRETEPSLKFENVRIRFVQRADFRHQSARTWEEVQWVAFRAFLTRAEVTERFGSKIGEAIGLDSDPTNIDDNEHHASNAGSGEGAKATVWEIWDKAKNKVLWIAKNWPDVLEEGAPYLTLDGFYPCPRPAYGTLTPDSLVPVPDYVFYQDQCEEIDQLTARIGALSDALKLVGFYPAGPQGDGSPEIEKAFSAGFENKMVAVQAWDSFVSGQSGAPRVVFLPIDQVIKVLDGCVKLRQQLVEDVYQIVGIPDIMRGATDPQETEGAQQLKSQHAGTRIRDRQMEIARFCGDMGRLCGQVIASYCSPGTVEKMTNIKLPTQQDVLLAKLVAQQQMLQQAAMANVVQLHSGMGPQAPTPVDATFGRPLMAPPQGMQQAIPGANGQSIGGPPQPQPSPNNPGPTQEDVFGLLRDALTRRFKIDIENESTVIGDESQERQDRTGLIESVTKFMEAWGPMVMQKPELAPLAGQLLLFGVRSFRVGRELEDVIEETSDKLSASQNNQKGPDPKVQAEQVKLQGTQAKTQAEIQKSQIDAQTAQQAGAMKQQQMEMDIRAKIAEMQMKLAALQQEHQHKTVEAGFAHGAAMDKMAIEQQKAQVAQMPKWPVDPGKTQGF